MMLPEFLTPMKAAALALGIALSTVSASPLQGGALTDLFISARVTQGCTYFTSPYGAPVPVHYYVPKTNCASPAVVVLHGMDGITRYQTDYDAIGKGLAAKGYAAFFVQYFEGSPQFPHPQPTDTSLSNPAAFGAWKATVEQSISFVQSLPCVDSSRVGVLGMSLGGYVGTSAVANDARVKSLVVLSGGMPDQMESKMKWMPPTLIIHGDQDRDVPVTEAYKLNDRLNRKGIANTLRILPCEGHLPYRVYKENVAEQVLCFFDSTL